MEHLCDCDLSSATEATADDTDNEIEARLHNALSLSPFRQQFDNFASLIQLSTDSAQVRLRNHSSSLASYVFSTEEFVFANQGLTFEIFEQNLCDNLLGNLQQSQSKGTADLVVSAETLHAVLGTLRSSFTKSATVAMETASKAAA